MPDHSDPRRWVLLVTEGFTVVYPPEVYRVRRVAEREAERGAWLLSIESQTPIERPFEGRWQAGEHWVRLVDAHLYEETSEEVWVGNVLDAGRYSRPRGRAIRQPGGGQGVGHHAITRETAP